jgi:hypothetical protein
MDWPATKLRALPPQKAGLLLDSSQIVASIQSFRPLAFPIEIGTAIVQVVARFVVNVVDAHLLQPTRRAEATIQVSIGTEHRQSRPRYSLDYVLTEFTLRGVNFGLVTRFSNF